MKQKTISLYMSILICITMNIYGTQQRILPSASGLYESLYRLGVLQGGPPVSDSLPMSIAEIEKILSVYEGQGISKENQELYESIIKQLEVPYYGFMITPELYLHTSDSAVFSTDESWYHGYHDRSPIASVYGAFSFEDAIFGYAQMSANNDQFHIDTGDSTGFFSPHMRTNLIIDDSYDNFDASTPWRAYLSLGSHFWNVQVGRDLLRWGNGSTGNLVIDDHMDYHEYARFTAFDEKVKFSTLAVSFDHPSSYQEDIDFSDPIHGYELFIAHRLETQIGQRMRLSVSESIMYQGETLDLGIFNPLMFLHNLTIRGNANSLAEFSLSYTPKKGMNLYLQLVIDQLRVIGESNSDPSALGSIIGMKTITQLDAIKSFYWGIEVTYTDPYLYLRDGDEGYPIDFIVGYRKQSPAAGKPVDLEYLGYEYGGDVIALSVNAGLSSLDWGEMGITVVYLMHGCIDQDSIWGTGESFTSIVSPSAHDPNELNKDAVEKVLSCSYEVEGKVNRYTSLHANIDWVHSWNNQNRSDHGYEADLQISTGISIHI